MIPITEPFLGLEESLAAKAAVESGWVTQGPRVAEFERMVADYCGVTEAVAVSSGTAALHLAMVALGVGPGDEVICPSMSFIATANSIRYTGATAVFAEVDPNTYNLDPAAAEAAITPRTRAIVVVHQLGLPADIDAFLQIGKRHDLRIFEDAACAIGSGYKGKPIGGHTEMACFSFHPRKVITTGEGGMITTNNSTYAEQLRMLRHQGMSVSDAVRHHAKTVIAEDYPCLGYNYRLTDIQAAVGVEQMKRLDQIVRHRRELAERYRQALTDHPWLEPPHVPDYAQPNFQSYAVQLTDDAPLGRDQLMQQLLDAGIATRRGVMLAHLEKAYKDDGLRTPLPRSERASARSLLLPLFPQMTIEQRDQVIQSLFLAARAVPLADRTPQTDVKR